MTNDATRSPFPPPPPSPPPALVTQQSLNRTFRVLSVVTLLATVASWAVLAAMFAVQVPWYRKIFDDFGTDLPMPARVVIHFYVPLLMLLVAGLVFLVIKEFRVRRASICLAINLAAGICVTPAFWVMWWCLQQPMLKLISGVGTEARP